MKWINFKCTFDKCIQIKIIPPEKFPYAPLLSILDLLPTTKQPLFWFFSPSSISFSCSEFRLNGSCDMYSCVWNVLVSTMFSSVILLATISRFFLFVSCSPRCGGPSTVWWALSDLGLSWIKLPCFGRQFPVGRLHFCTSCKWGTDFPLFWTIFPRIFVLWIILGKEVSPSGAKGGYACFPL